MDKRKGSTHARSRGRVEGQSDIRGVPGEREDQCQQVEAEMEGQEHDMRRK